MRDCTMYIRCLDDCVDTESARACDLSSTRFVPPVPPHPGTRHPCMCALKGSKRDELYGTRQLYAKTRPETGGEAPKIIRRISEDRFNFGRGGERDRGKAKLLSGLTDAAS